MDDEDDLHREESEEAAIADLAPQKPMRPMRAPEPPAQPEQQVPTPTYGAPMTAPQGTPTDWLGRPDQNAMKSANIGAMQDIARSALQKPVETGNLIERHLPEASLQTMVSASDPEKQWRVKQEEAAITALQNDKTLSEPQRQAAIGQRQKNLQVLDSGGMYQRGGVLSRMTKAQKYMAENSVTDLKNGVLTIFDPKGNPHTTKLDNHDDKRHEAEMKREDRQRAIEAHQMEMEKRAEERQRLADQHALDNSASRQKEIADEVRKEKGHMFDHEDKLDPKGRNIWTEIRNKAATPEAERERRAHESVMNRRGKAANEQLDAESDKAEQVFLGPVENSPVKNRVAYNSAYRDLHHGKGPASTTKELEARHKEALSLMDHRLAQPKVKSAADFVAEADAKLKALPVPKKNPFIHGR